MSSRKLVGLFAGLFLVFSFALVLSACGHPAVVYVNAPPPPPVVESMTVSPGPGWVWIPGHHRWDGAAYAWAPGHWERRPGGRGEWIPGHWVHGDRGWFWVEGHWRRA